MFLISSVLKVIPWETLIKLVWDYADDDVKKRVIESDNKIDDAAFKIVDQFIQEL